VVEGWARRHRLPGSLYADRDSIYRCEGTASVAEQLAGREPQTQFGRAMEQLGVELILHATQPRALIFPSMPGASMTLTPSSNLSKAIGSLGGNLMNAVYDATAREAWLSYAEKNECTYRRSYVQVNLMDFVPYNSANPKVKVEKIVP
jgi:hypothetical protein